MKLRLTPLTKQYIEFIRTIRNNPDVSKFLFTDARISKASQEKWYRKYINDRTIKIFVVNINEPIGFCQCKHIDYIHHSCELGFFLAPHFHNKGLGSIVVRTLQNYAIKQMKMHRLYVEVFSYHHVAIRVYSKCGFVKEGIMREKIFKLGSYHDVVLMSYVQKK